MKQLVLIGVLILGLFGYGFYLMIDKSTPPSSAPVPIVADAPTSVTNNPAEIFRKAFWRHPSPTDKILNAERREWSGSGELEKWQSFLVVEPSPELVKYLITENGFNLVESSQNGPVHNPPKWFAPPASGVKILKATGGQMQLIFDSAKNLLFASDSGKGFQAGAEKPIPRPSEPSTPGGRLPANPPPDPRK